MSDSVVGSLLGLTAGTGAVLAVFVSPPMRPVRLYDRVAPYLGEVRATSRLLASSGDSAPFLVLSRLFGPAVLDVARTLERLVGGTSSVRRRLAGLGLDPDVEAFRLEQAVWGAVSMCGSALLTLGVGLLRGSIDPVIIGGAAFVGGLTGILARDWCLSRQLRNRERRMLGELPVVADLLALSVVAGEGPGAALARVTAVTRGELARDLDAALRRARSGTAVVRALADVAGSTTCEPFGRLLAALAIAIERGTPLAEVLRAQAMDARDVAQRALLDAGGKKEISMMLPVVFMILPVTVLFALYPGLLTLTSIAR